MEEAHDIEARMNHLSHYYQHFPTVHEGLVKFCNAELRYLGLPSASCLPRVDRRANRLQRIL